MRNIALLACIFLCVQLINSQYTNGYIVTKDGENKIGLVKNQNWNNHPERINFKTSIEGSVQTIEIVNLSEFGIGNDIKFLVREVNVDVSPENINNLNNSKNPVFESKTIALRKLVDGKISLYEYQFSKGIRFYTKQANENFEPLIYKKYVISSNKIGINEHFKQQLSLLFEDKRSDLEKKLGQVSYSRKSIAKLVSEYNYLTSSNSTDYYGKIDRKTKLNFNLVGGMEKTSVSYEFGNVATLNPSFPDISRFMYGVELELLFFKERIGLFTGYTFKSAVSETIDLQTSVAGLTQETTFSYKNNSWSIGARGHIETIKNLDLILTVGFTREFVSDFSIDLEISDVKSDFIRNAGAEFYGFGLAYKNLFAEVRFFNNKIFVENVANSATVDNSNFNIRIGYSIL